MVYDLDAALEAEQTAAAADAADADPPGDTGDADETDEEPAYEPREFRVEVEATRDIPRGSVVLRGARVITMVGEQVIEQADIFIEDGIISEVGRRGSIDFPDGTRIIDLSGTTIVPGFVDTHAHLRPSFGVHKTQSWAYLANLAYGVTTTRDPQTGSTDVLTYGDMVEAGKMLGPRIYSTGPGVFVAEQIEDLDHARDVLTRYSGYYDTKTIKMYMSGNRQQRQWIIMAANEQQLLPTTEGGLDMKYNLEMLIDGYPGQEHSFPVAPLYDDVVRLTAESKMAYTPTLLVSYGGPFGENYFYTQENPHDDAKLQRFTPARRARPQDPAPGSGDGSRSRRVVPGRGIRPRAPRQGAQGHRRGGGASRCRQPRAAPGVGLPLGALADALRWPERARRPPGGHYPGGRVDRSCGGPGLDRGRQAGRPRGAGR